MAVAEDQKKATFKTVQGEGMGEGASCTECASDLPGQCFAITFEMYSTNIMYGNRDFKYPPITPVETL
jgi:hypothetical protein